MSIGKTSRAIKPLLMEELVAKFPSFLRTRTRFGLSSRTFVPDGKHVLYWAHSCLRVYENPAFEMACGLAKRIANPLVVVIEVVLQNNARQMAFILEGAREFAEVLQRKNIEVGVIISQPERADNALISLAEQSSIIVTDDVPIARMIKVLKDVERATEAPVLRVNGNTALSLFPLATIEYKDFALFKTQTENLRTRDFGRSWPRHALRIPSRPNVPNTFFQQNDTSKLSFIPMLSSLAVDQSVPASQLFRGGTNAGIILWDKIRRYGLDRYPLINGYAPAHCFRTMLPYLRYGMVSPFAMLHNIVLEGNENKDLLEDIFLWREFCYAYDNFYMRGAAGPAPNPVTGEKRAFGMEALQNGQTDDAAWNRIQTHLKATGVLPEHLFPMWIGSLLGWLKPWSFAVQTAENLYRRFALDGDDPVAVASFRQAIGQYPGDAVPGTILGRDKIVEVSLLNTLQDNVLSPPLVNLTNTKPVVAVVGAGIAGLSAANILHEQGFKVKVFEKNPCPGGRMASILFQEKSFDTGSNIFNVTHPGFRAEARRLMQNKRFAAWKHNSFVSNAQSQHRLAGQSWVATPSMQACAEFLSQKLECQYNTNVGTLERRDGGWTIYDANNQSLGFYDHLILAVPSTQAVALLKTVALLPPDLMKLIKTAPLMQPMWSTIAIFDESLDIKHESINIHSKNIHFACRENKKPGRSMELDSWVLHSSTDFANAHRDTSPDEVALLQVQALMEHFSLPMQEPMVKTAVFWPDASVQKPFGRHYALYHNIGLCGDWCLGNRLEDAYVSGTALASALIHQYLFKGGSAIV
jgi:predicted NAD/FAD-dependent oxidoreductase/deoxyribodipyrimidine photolyase